MAQTGIDYLKNGYSLIGVQSQDVNAMWDVLLPWIERGLEHERGCYWPLDIYKAVEAQTMQLWVVLNKQKALTGVVVTEVIVYPRRKLLNVFLLSGKECAAWRDAWFYIEAWSKSIGCDGATSYSRPGVARFVKEEGFVTFAHLVGKDYNDSPLQ